MSFTVLYACVGVGTVAVVLFVVLSLTAPLVLEIGYGIIGGLLVLGGIGWILYRNSDSIGDWWQAFRDRRQAERDARRVRRETLRQEEETRRAVELEERRVRAGVIAVEAISSGEAMNGTNS
ncbi:uncharacterized protein LY89DRAFT_670664 [Mollisia scopiformis]|uniref:Uncharacterized protein n=1 Tax=Mollisia scopiformis TaxID=149040 RepID=A0A194X4R0_MOLSC|nr:uncharacterized protein LY89DRAFT_670664 [Mollisia scopiformis]KUJ15160.1 hypothetical protein LY89DRAFT_670664 [Mollisia scopiformis]